MNRVTALVALCVLCGAALHAQASVDFSGSVSGINERWILIEVDFGMLGASINLDVEAQAIGTSDGLDVELFDLDELAENGPSNASNSGDDPANGLITFSLATGAYSGVRQFMLIVETWNYVSTSNFEGSVSSMGVPADAITVREQRTLTFPNSLSRNMMQRWRLYYREYNTASVYSNEFRVDFGDTPQSITFYISGLVFDGTRIELFEIDEDGTPISRSFATGTFDAFIEDAITTAPRTGKVRFRVEVTPNAAGDPSLMWYEVVLPSTVKFASSGSSSSGGGGCSARPSNSYLMLLLLALLAVPAAARVVSRTRQA